MPPCATVSLKPLIDAVTSRTFVRTAFTLFFSRYGTTTIASAVPCTG